MTFLELALAYLPDGAYTKDLDATHVLELDAYMTVLQDSLDTRAGDLRDEMYPDTAVELLEDWERVLGLHPKSGDTIAQRQAKAAEAWSRDPLMTPVYVRDQLEQLTGIEPTIVEHTPFFCDDPDSLVDVDSIEMQWTWFASWDRAAAVAAGMDDDLREEQELVDRLGPRHGLGIACCDDFLCDDPYSLTDRDLLGA